MSQSPRPYETAYAHLLATLWDDIEDLLDSHYGRHASSPDGERRLRLKLSDLRLRLGQLIEHTQQHDREHGGASRQTTELRHFAAELLRLIDTDGPHDEPAAWNCGPTMVLAQNRILDEAQRLALAR
jgi:hypothetical protein